MIEFTVQQQLAKVNEALVEYIRYTKLSTDEVLERKGRDLNIKIFQRFWSLRVRATRAQRSKANAVFTGPLFDEAKARGWRVKLRKGIELQARYRLARAKTRGGPKTKRNRLNDRALLVAQELATRQRHSGLLGVSFLQRRWRRGTPIARGGGGPFLSTNKSGQLGIISTVEKKWTPEQGSLKITSHLPAVGIMDRKHGFLAGALAAVLADTMIYIDRKQKELADRSLRKIA